MHILVTGGAGYVGSHIVRALLDAGHSVAVVDDLSSGHRRALPAEVPLVVGSCGDREVLDRVAGDRRFDAVMHMAARSSVGESMKDPSGYYRTNVVESLGLLDWMVERGVDRIVHSSTCAVYGETLDPIDESLPPLPVNAYGATKLAVDRALVFYGEAHELRGVSLRYFNAAGAHPSGDIGEDKRPLSNLIPRVLSVALGKLERIEIYGDDYPTADGTGVRDYVHVVDLADAHLRALQALNEGRRGVFNVGTGTGHSVLEVIEEARSVTGHPIPTAVRDRRPGDPAVLVAAVDKVTLELGWRPRRSDLRTIIRDAWRWHRDHPEGFEAVDTAGEAST